MSNFADVSSLHQGTGLPCDGKAAFGALEEQRPNTLRAGSADSKRAGGPPAGTQPGPPWCHHASQLLGPMRGRESIWDSTWVGEGIPSKAQFWAVLCGLVHISGIWQAPANTCCLSIRRAEAVPPAAQGHTKQAVHPASCSGSCHTGRRDKAHLPQRVGRNTTEANS